MRRAACFSSTDSRAQASMRSPRRPRRGSPRSMRVFPSKQALFTAVVERLVRRKHEP